MAYCGYLYIDGLANYRTSVSYIFKLNSYIATCVAAIHYILCSSQSSGIDTRYTVHE